MPRIFFIFVSIILACCNHPSAPAGKAMKGFERMAPLDTTSEDYKLARVPADSVKITRRVYVINRGGIEARQLADSSSEVYNTYVYGDRLSVVEEKGNWLGVLNEASGEPDDKVYVWKSETGPITDVRLISTDLAIISSLTKKDSTIYSEKGDTLKGYLKAELIDEALYLSKKSTAVSFLLQDTTAIRTRNGITDLPCKNKHWVLKDNPNDNDNYVMYNYIGHIDFLDAYLVGAMYYEDGAVIFVDRITSEELTQTGNVPSISPDKKYMVSLYANPYDITGDLELYSLKGGHITHLVSAAFKYWMPADNGAKPVFWSSDGYLYLPALHSQVYWGESGNLNEHVQYMRIKILTK